jgi:hypothetical protein
MASFAKLLREPPEAFLTAMSGLHQDVDLISRAEGESWAQHVISFVRKTQFGALAAYLDSILEDERISNADLKGLINRYNTGMSFRKAGDARQFLEALRDELRVRRENQND